MRIFAVFSIFCLAFASAYVTSDVDLFTVKSFPLVHGGKVYGNPAIMDIGPDGKLYVGLAGDILDPYASVPKGIFRTALDGFFELVFAFPDQGGFIEKIMFDANGDLYVNLANYWNMTLPFSNGLVKIDVTAKTAVQVWNSTGTLIFPAGLAQDSAENFYITDPVTGAIAKVTPYGEGSIISRDSLLRGHAYTGGNGAAISSEDELYVMNFDEHLLLNVDLNTGAAHILVNDTVLQNMDQLNFSPDEKYLFSSAFGYGTTVRFNLKNKNKIRMNILTTFSDGLGTSVQMLPGAGLVDGSGFVSVLDPFVPQGGRIVKMTPVCESSGYCSLY